MELTKKASKNEWVSNVTNEFIEKEYNTSAYKDELENVDLQDSEDTSKTENYVLDRILRMTTAKSEFIKEINQTDINYESKTDFIINWSQYFNFPMEESVVSILEAELGERDIVYKIEPTGTLSDVNKIKPNQIVMDRIYSQDTTSKKMVTFREHFFKYWMWVAFEWMKKEKRITRKNNEKFNWVLLKWKTEVKNETYDIKLWSRIVHPVNFYIDDAAITFDEAQDCAEMEELGKNDIISKFNWAEFFNKTRMVDSLTDLWNKVFYYYNKMIDTYCITVNSILIYEGASPFAHDQLPYTVAIMSVDDKSPYGRGWIVKKLRFAKPYLNEIFNIIMSQSKNANRPPILIWGGANLQWQSPTFKTWAIWQFSGTISEVREMKVTPPDTSMFNIVSILQDLVVQLLGIDTRSIYSSSNKTKFEAWLIEQAKNKRLWAIGKTLDYAYGVLLNQRLKNSHYFLTVVAAEEIIDPNNIKKGWYKKILLKDQQVTEKEDWTVDFETVPGAYSEFELKPETINWSFNIEVVTESTKPILKEIAQENMKTSIEAATLASNLMQVNPELSTMINLNWLIKEIFTTYGIDTENIMMDTQSQRYADQFKKIQETILNETMPDQNPGDQFANQIVNWQ